jgi:hypothetical protein
LSESPAHFFSSSFTTLRVGLALHRLHRLADEEAEQRFLAALVLLDLVGIVGQDFCDRRFDRAGIASASGPRSSTIWQHCRPFPA